MIGEHTVAVGSVTEQAVRKNLATVRPPGTNGSATITPGVSYAGRSWSRLTTAVAGHGARLLVNAADLVNGQTYTASWLVANDGDAPVLVQIDWVDQNAPTALIAPGEVRRLYAPGSRATYDGTYRFSDLAIREVSSILFADVMVEAGDTDGAFFNGDTPDTPTADYAWTGAAGASTSTETGPVWSDISCLVDEVSINHGRDDSGSQPDASSATLTLSPDQTGALPLPAAVEIGATIRVTTTLAGTTYDRFVGRLTDISLGWDDAGEGTPDEGIGQLVATGVLADLGRRVIGDVPWPQELDGARVSRIMAAAGIALDPLYSDPGTVQILARDVDAQPALELAQGVAADAGGILWQTRSGVVRYADAEHRRGTTTSLALDACDTLVTPTWQRTTEGLINDVSIGYGAVPEGGEQPRTYASNAASIAR